MNETLHSPEVSQPPLVTGESEPPAPVFSKLRRAGQAGRLTLVGRGSVVGLGVLFVGYGLAYLFNPAWQLLVLMGVSVFCIGLFRLCVYLAGKDRIVLGAYLGLLSALVMFASINLLLADSVAPAVVGGILGVTIVIYVLGSERTLSLIVIGTTFVLLNLALAWPALASWIESLPRLELPSSLGLASNLVALAVVTVMVSLLMAFTGRDFQMTLRRARRYADELRDAQAALEKQVLERTQELAEANERLLETNFQLKQAQQETEEALEQLASANEENRRALAQLRQMNEALKTVTQRSQWKVGQIESVVEISREVAAILNLPELLNRAVDLIYGHFEASGVHHVSIFMLDEVGQNLVVQAGTGELGQRMLALRHHFGKGEQSLVGWVAVNLQPRVISGDEATRLADQLSLPELKKTQAEVAIPLVTEGELLGVLDVHGMMDHQNSMQELFGGEQVAVFQAIGDQIAMAISNARRLTESENRLIAIEEAQRQYVGHVWEEYLETKSLLGFEYDLRAVGPAAGELPPEAQAAAKTGQTAVATGRWPETEAIRAESVQTGQPDQASALAVPIKVRGAVIGALGLQRADTPEGAARSWRQEDIDLLETVGREVGLALETARLLEETQRRALREQFTRQITDKIRGAGDIEGILQTTIRELSRTLRVPRVLIQLTAPAVSEQEVEDT